MSNTRIKSAQHYQDLLNDLLTELMPLDWEMQKGSDIEKAKDAYVNSRVQINTMINELVDLYSNIQVDFFTFLQEHDI